MNQPDHIIRGDELPATSRTGLHLPDGGDDRLFYGRVKWAQLRDGLSLHWSDCEELQDFVTENTVDPRVSFVLFLQGQSQVSYGDLSLTLGHQLQMWSTLVQHRKQKHKRLWLQI